MAETALPESRPSRPSGPEPLWRHLLGDEPEHRVAHMPEVVRLGLDLDGGTADAGRALMHEDARVRQRSALPLRSR